MLSIIQPWASKPNWKHLTCHGCVGIVSIKYLEFYFGLLVEFAITLSYREQTITHRLFLMELRHVQLLVFGQREQQTLGRTAKQRLDQR